jgi:hypothetical protein
MHRPPQQSLPSAQVSPWIRHPGGKVQRRPPSGRSAQGPLQHSWSLVQASPAGRQLSPVAWQLPPTQAPLQQSRGAVQGAPDEAHTPPPHRPVAPQASAQQAEARSQV